MNPYLLITLLFFAAVMGDTLNYHIGKYIGPKVFETQSRWINKEYLFSFATGKEAAEYKKAVREEKLAKKQAEIEEAKARGAEIDEDGNIIDSQDTKNYDNLQDNIEDNEEEELMGKVYDIFSAKGYKLCVEELSNVLKVTKRFTIKNMVLKLEDRDDNLQK